MSKEGVAFILGRACVDAEFFEWLEKDVEVAGKRAIEKASMHISPDELAAVKSVIKCQKELKSLQDCLKGHRLVYSFGS